jgi:hypothetical protein
MALLNVKARQEEAIDVPAPAVPYLIEKWLKAGPVEVTA